MKVIIFLLLSVVGVFAQAPLKGTNLWLTTPPVQSTAGSIARFLTLSTAGVGETVTPTKLWDAVVLTGTVDTTDIGGFSALGRNLVDDVTTGDMQTTLGANTVGKSLFTLTNPSAITFLRVNADNTVTARTVTETKTDLSLGNVDNTSDANKPVSTAAQTALNLKANADSPTFTNEVLINVNGGGNNGITFKNIGGDPGEGLKISTISGVAWQFENTASLVPVKASIITHTGNIGSGEPCLTIASNTSISLSRPYTFVSGTAVISEIVVDPTFGTGSYQITIIPTGVFTTNTSGNIALASTAVVNRALIMTYDSGTGKWYPSY